MNSDKEIKSYDDVMTPDVLANEEHKLHQDQSIDFNDELNSSKFVDSVNVCDELQQLHNTSSAINIDDLLKKKIKQQDRSNSTGKLYESCRRVSFPVNDCDLVTGYLEPANPWATVKPIANVSELSEIYKESCEKHNTIPIESIMKHLVTLDLGKPSRLPILNLREQTLTAESCEALEEVLKRVQYKLIDLTDCGLNDTSAQALFEMIEYYEAANEVDISENRNITARGWQSCINMIKRSHALQTLATRCTPLSDSNAINLGKAMLGSSLFTLKLEHCGLSGRPIASLCLYLRRNTVLKELWLAHNDLTSCDASNISTVLKANLHLQFLDISNNNIEDAGVFHITEALIEQAKQFKNIHEPLMCNADVMPNKPHTNHKIALSYDESINVGELNKSISSINDTMLRNASEAPSKRSVLETLLETHKYIESNNAAKDGKLAKDGDGDKEHSIAAESHVDNKLQAIFEKSDSNSNVETSTVPFNSLELVELNKICESAAARDDIELKIVEEDELPVTYADVLKTSDDSDKDNSAAKVTDGLILNDPTLNVCVDNNNSLVDFMSDKNVEKCFEQPMSSVQTNQNPIFIDAATETSFDINENNSTDRESSLNCNERDLISFDDKLNDDQVFSQNLSNSTKSTKTDSDLPIDSHCIFAALDDVEAPMFVNEMDNTATGVGESTVIDAQPFDIPLIVSRSPPLNASTETPPATPQTPISPNILSSADTHLFISDSSQSLDSINELGTSFETKGFHISAAPERSFSSESLNSEDSNDSKSSIKLTEAKFSKNGTLERQSNNVIIPAATTTPCGLQVLVLWNNRITREAAKSISDLLAVTTTLEILNVGRNVLSNDFLTDIKSSLKSNTSLTSLGLQSAHFTCAGMKTLSEIIEFGGNSTLQRIDLRDNHLQVGGLTVLNDAIKSNKSLTRIDLDDVPRRAYELGGDSSIDYSRMVINIRAHCAHNENPPDPEPVRTSAMKRVRTSMLNSRKISLTCQSIRNLDPAIQPKVERHLLDPNRKTGGRLRSPLPSPIPSPVSSPAPSPSRNRFHVSRVVDGTSPITPPSSASCSPTFPNTANSSSRFRVSIVEPTTKQTPKFVYGNNSTTKDLTTAVPNKTDPSTTVLNSTPSANSIPITTTTTKQPPTIEHVNITTASLLHSMSSSFDSPDMEVKQYMDDSCSSISSMDSIDRHRDFINTSMSSTESFDLVLPEHTKKASLPRCHADVKVSTFEAIPKDTIPSNNKIHDSLSSLEANSTDSSYGSQDIPVPTSSSNEGTLTNSPSSPSYPHICDKTIEGKTDLLAVKSQEKRGRSTSWMSNPIAMAKNDVYPATLDKLLSIFQHPGNFFSRSSSNDGSGKSSKDTSPQNTENKPPSRKESPMGGLFAWTTNKKDHVSDDNESRTNVELNKVAKAPLQSNLLPENVTAPTEAIDACLINSKMKQEMKENISPEHTITATSVKNIKSQIVEMRELKSEKVHFEVGGDDDDDVIDVADDDVDDDENDNLPVDSSTSNLTTELNTSDTVTARSSGCSSDHNPMSDVVTCSNKSCLLGLGQKTRDSLSIIKGHSKNSQDSMRSLESLTEVDKIEPFVDAASSQ